MLFCGGGTAPSNRKLRAGFYITTTAHNGGRALQMPNANWGWVMWARGSTSSRTWIGQYQQAPKLKLNKAAWCYRYFTMQFRSPRSSSALLLWRLRPMKQTKFLLGTRTAPDNQGAQTKLQSQHQFVMQLSWYCLYVPCTLTALQVRYSHH